MRMGHRCAMPQPPIRGILLESGNLIQVWFAGPDSRLELGWFLGTSENTYEIVGPRLA